MGKFCVSTDQYCFVNIMGTFQKVFLNKLLFYGSVAVAWSISSWCSSLFSGNAVLSRRPRVANFSDIIKLAVNLIKTTFPWTRVTLLKLFSNNKNYKFWWKMLMSFQQNFRVFQLIIILTMFQYNWTKIHHYGICMADFSWVVTFCNPLLLSRLCVFPNRPTLETVKIVVLILNC